jgi:hypothetical protein
VCLRRLRLLRSRRHDPTQTICRQFPAKTLACILPCACARSLMLTQHPSKRRDSEPPTILEHFYQACIGLPHLCHHRESNFMVLLRAVCRSKVTPAKLHIGEGRMSKVLSLQVRALPDVCMCTCALRTVFVRICLQHSEHAHVSHGWFGRTPAADACHTRA